MRKTMIVMVMLLATGLCGGERGWYPHEGGLLQYRVNIRFGEEPDTMPEGWKFGRVSAVATDSAGQVYVFQRGRKADPIIVFDAKGKYLRSWAKGMFGNPHGMRVGRNDHVWVTDNGDHQVMKFTRQGQLLLTLGIKRKPGEDDKTFNRPTDIAFAPSGDFYVSDGYGNSRVVKFSPDGKYLLAWGKRGTGPGEFNIPHSIAVDSKGLGLRQRPREQPNSNLRRRRQVPAAVDAPGSHAKHFHHPQGRDMGHHPPQQHRESYLRHAGRADHAHRPDHRQDTGRDGEPGTLDPREPDRGDFHRQPDRQRVPVVSGLAAQGSRQRGRPPAGKSAVIPGGCRLWQLGKMQAADFRSLGHAFLHAVLYPPGRSEGKPHPNVNLSEQAQLDTLGGARGNINLVR